MVRAGLLQSSIYGCSGEQPDPGRYHVHCGRRDRDGFFFRARPAAAANAKGISNGRSHARGHTRAGSWNRARPLVPRARSGAGIWKRLPGPHPGRPSFRYSDDEARLETFDFTVLDAARDLGASPWRTFRDITFPLIRPTVLGAALLATALSLDEFVVTWFNIGNSQTLPVLIWGLLRRGIDPSINAHRVRGSALSRGSGVAGPPPDAENPVRRPAVEIVGLAKKFGDVSALDESI